MICALNIDLSPVIRSICMLVLAAVTLTLGVGKASAQGAADAPTLYQLNAASSFQQGCFAPCLCPILLAGGVRGTFVLTSTGFDGLFNTSAVTEVNWIAAVGDQEVRVTGSGTYKVGGEVAVQQQLTLDLKVGDAAVQHFDSGLVTGGGQFPDLSVPISLHGQVCFDTVLLVDASPVPPDQIHPICLDDEFDGVGLDPNTWDIFKGSPIVVGSQLILAGGTTRADIQSKTVCQYGILHAVITSSDWKPQTSTTDASFGFEFFDGNCHYGVILVANGILGLLRSEPDSNNNCSTQSAGIPGRLPSDPKFQEYIKISNWDTVRARRTIFLTLIWAPNGVTLHVSDGGSNSGVASYSGVAVPNIPLKIRLNADFGETYTIDYIRVGNLLLRLYLNQTTFHTGDTLRLALEAQNLVPAFHADFYLGILLPDGVSLCFFTSLSPDQCFVNPIVTRLGADPRTFSPLAGNILISQGLDIPINDVFSVSLQVGMPGTYIFFTVLTPPSAFSDGKIHPGDLLALDAQAFTFSP